MGRIRKYGMDRLEERNIELRFDCPYCGRSKIALKYQSQEDLWNGVVCHKCKNRVILDNISLTVVQTGMVDEEVKPAIQESVTIS